MATRDRSIFPRDLASWRFITYDSKMLPAKPLASSSFVITALLLIGLYLCYRIAVPFMPALVWALTLAVIFTPLQRRIENKVPHPNLATAVSLLVVAVCVVLPATFVVTQLAAEIARGADAIRHLATKEQFRETLASQPLLSSLADWIEHQVDLPETFGRAATWLTNTAASFVRGSVTQFIGILLTFYFLFYFLRDRQRVLNSMRTLLPLSSSEMKRLYSRSTATIHATVYGTLAMAALQGLLGGLMFWILGLPSPLLWGIVMALLAIIPVLGAFVIWIPAALWLFSQGHWGKALILTAWGGIVVATIDNLIYPILVGNRIKQPTMVAFIALVGGLLVFDSAGLIIGPLVITITFLLLEIQRERKPVNR
jgi:predicted PurR-regulated permease PerM